MLGVDFTRSAISCRPRSVRGRAEAAARRRASVTAVAATVFATLAVAVVIDDEPSLLPRERKRLHVWERVSVAHALRYFSEVEFARALRMSRGRFTNSCELLVHD
jgi:hypothetical protein